MITFPIEKIQEATDLLHTEADHPPVAISFEGKPDLVMLSMAHYERLRASQRKAWTLDTMPGEMLERLANARMSPEDDHLNDLLDD